MNPITKSIGTVRESHKLNAMKIYHPEMWEKLEGLNPKARATLAQKLRIKMKQGIKPTYEELMVIILWHPKVNILPTT